MPVTQYVHRVLIIIPVARQAAMNTWAKANLDPGGGENTFTVPLNPSGDNTQAATHYWCSIAVTRPQLRLVVLRLAVLAGLTQPNWDNLTGPQKLQWIADNKAAIQTNTGIRFFRDDYDQKYTDPGTALSGAGLKTGTVANQAVVG